MKWEREKNWIKQYTNENWANIRVSGPDALCRYGNRYGTAKLSKFILFYNKPDIHLLNMVINELYHSDMPVNGIQTYVS